MPDTMAAIVDEEGASCPVGEGTWIDGRVDTAMFVPHDGGDGSRIFATGDLARCHADGVFVVLGRRDRMAKVNGQRLDPSEIERVLRSQPGVDDAEVIVDGRRGRVLAFVSLAAQAPAESARGLRLALRGALPAFMVPSRIVEVGTMPRLPGGKVDALALQRLADATGAADAVPPAAPDAVPPAGPEAGS
jgi:acyl-coenzyme A synthetase/AMP-(fatty) acid ligase